MSTEERFNWPDDFRIELEKADGDRTITTLTVMARTTRQAAIGGATADMHPPDGYRCLDYKVSTHGHGGRRRKLTLVMQYCDDRKPAVRDWNVSLKEVLQIVRGVPEPLR